MIKLFGLLLLFSSSVLVGVSMAQRLKERVALLLALRLLMQSIKAELSISMPELHELFSHSSNERTKPITDRLSERLQAGLSPRESADDAFSSPYAKRLLAPQEREYLARSLSALGMGDLKCACETLDAACSQLDVYITQASENEKQNTKVSLALSVYTGLAVVIVLL